jgi:hypothetical protein
LILTKLRVQNGNCQSGSRYCCRRFVGAKSLGSQPLVLEAATSEREPCAGSHVAARVRLMEIASSSGLLSTSPLQTRKIIFRKKFRHNHLIFRFSFLSLQPCSIAAEASSISMNTVASLSLMPHLLIKPSFTCFSRKVSSLSFCSSFPVRIFLFCFSLNSYFVVSKSWMELAISANG